MVLTNVVVCVSFVFSVASRFCRWSRPSFLLFSFFRIPSTLAEVSRVCMYVFSAVSLSGLRAIVVFGARDLLYQLSNTYLRKESQKFLQ